MTSQTPIPERSRLSRFGATEPGVTAIHAVGLPWLWGSFISSVAMKIDDTGIHSQCAALLKGATLAAAMLGLLVALIACGDDMEQHRTRATDARLTVSDLGPQWTSRPATRIDEAPGSDNEFLSVCDVTASSGVMQFSRSRDSFAQSVVVLSADSSARECSRLAAELLGSKGKVVVQTTIPGCNRDPIVLRSLHRGFDGARVLVPVGERYVAEMLFINIESDDLAISLISRACTRLQSVLGR